MPRQRWKELDATVDIDHNPGYDLSTLTKPPPQVPSGLSTPSNFSFVCANYKWNVRREAIVKQSKVFGMITSVHFKEGNEQTINLPEDEPDLLARMIQFCYFEKYSLSPITPLAGRPYAKTVERMMSEGFCGDQEHFKTPCQPTCDAVLHMKMYDLADKYDMDGMGQYAMRKIWSCLQGESGEHDAFWRCVDFLDEMAEMAAEQVIKSCLVFATCRSAASKSQVDFDGDRFGELERLRPEMAQELRKKALHR